MKLSELRAPFPAEAIEWRISQAGKTQAGKLWAQVLAYVTNRAIMDRLDAVCGPENWKNEFRPGPDGGVMCGIAIRIGEEWVWKWDGADKTQVDAIKGGFSASMKRAAVQWGIGRYLYDLPEGWALIHEKGALRGKTKEGVRFLWDPPALPAWALPPPPPISPAQLAELHQLIQRAGVNEVEFLRWLQVDSLENIPAAEFQRAHKALQAKLRQRQQQPEEVAG